MDEVAVVGAAVASHRHGDRLTVALEAGKLTVWLGTNRDDAAVRTIAEKSTEDLGVEVTVEVVDPDLPLKFQQAAATGDGPDIVLWPHDRFGEWAQAGLISPVEPSDAVKASALASGWDAVTFGGQTWGYPVFVEAIALIYNKDLVPTPPASCLAAASAAAILPAAWMWFSLIRIPS